MTDIPQLGRSEPWYAVYTEMVDRSERHDFDAELASAAPLAAVNEFAKLLTTFDDKIPDDQRATIIDIAAALLLLDKRLGATK